MLVLALLACGSPCDPGPEPWLEVGLGAEGFQPAADGAEAPIVYGPQGGYHVDLALQGAYFDGDDVASAEIVGERDGVPAAFATPWFQFGCDVEAEAQRVWGIRLILDGQPADFADRTLDVEATVTDARGRSASATRSLVLRDL